MARQRTAKGPSSPAWVQKHPRGAPAVALLACFIGLTGPSAARSESAMLDLSRAVVVTPPARTGPQRKAVELPVEDVARRSGIRWYAGDSFRNPIRLDADEHPVHEWFKKPDPPVPVEFGMLSQATADGTLTLTWRHEPGKGANGRGCQVAKVWLIRK
ncbi:MAG: hypothetical protein ACXVBY_01005 [Isosphaeraceae bacterium]